MSQTWKRGIDYPEFLTEEGLTTLKGGYLLDGETPMQMYARVAHAAASNVHRTDLEAPMFEALIKNWICLASPVAANVGTTRGLPISCFGLTVSDSVAGISTAYNELMMMAKGGGGVGVSWSGVRGRGTKIAQNGVSNGTIPWIKVQDSLTAAVNQGSVRNGASSVYMSINHPDIEEFIRIRRPKGDPNTRCHNLHHAVVYDDAFMQKVELGDPEARKLWMETIKMRKETGEPYQMHIDNVNRKRPKAYVDNGLFVTMSQLCSEIVLYCDETHSFVCCLSSMNLARYHEWKGKGIPYLATWLLDGVMQDFINKAEGLPGMEKARRFAVKSRALGLGGLGWHSLLQAEMTPFNSLRAKILNKAIWKEIREDADRASQDMAKYLGEVEWTKGLGERHTHKLAIAPTTSNATMSSDSNGHTVSFSIEPWPGNIFTQKSAKGTFVRYNPMFTKMLEEHKKFTPDVIQSVVEARGSVQHLSFLTDEQREVFKTAYEIDQFAIIEQAADRQEFLDQGQSLNLFFKADVDLRYFNAVHLDAYKKGLFTLYYVRSESPIQGDTGVSTKSDDTDLFTPIEPAECTSCEG
jgi:ribonucleoside-diphosphate reductase alpha chain